jgi:Ca2+-binding RTX toxin-like protein
VQSSVSHTLGSNVENLVLTGADAVNGTGNSLANTITGNQAANRLTGNGGNDLLDGGAGADTMLGGSGNDTYIVDDAADAVIESRGNGRDTVVSSVDYTLGSNVENLELSGEADIDGTGNSLSNNIVGNDGDNRLDGTAGNDTLTGGEGADVFVASTGRDRVTDFEDGVDLIDVGREVDDPWLTQNVSDLATGARIQSGTNSSIELVGVYSVDITAEDFV